jgi:RNA polymerase sigma-70 factor (ECF subfamily)
MADGPDAEFDFHRAFAGLFRESYGRVAAALAKEFRDLELAEDALQEALTTAAQRWPRDGIPDNAAGWLYVVARRRAIDALRREARQHKNAAAGARRLPPQESAMSGMYGVSGPPDERLSLIFACCHPVINEPAQVALTLHTLTGISTANIAASFLQKEATVAQRIVRAKRKIKQAGIPFAIPDMQNSPERLAGVLSVIYLIFNAGYAAHQGASLIATNLCDEALFLARMLAQLVLENSEVAGLLALILFQDSRRAARTAPDGSLVLLADQDRTLWDRAKIEEGLNHLARARQASHARRDAGVYQIQAEIAAVHAESAR